MKIAIIGAGAVGGYFGGKLSNAGFEVSFLARGKHLQKIQDHGLVVNSDLGNFVATPYLATHEISRLGKIDLLILGIKAWQVKGIANELRYCIHQDTVILPLQNGVLTADELTETIPASHITAGLCKILCKIDSPGIITQVGINPEIVFGELNDRKSDRTRRIKDIFDQAGIHSRIADNIETELWKKFIIGCVSGLLAVTRTTYGELRQLDETRQMMIALLTEIYNLALKIGIGMPSDYVPTCTAMIDSFPYDGTSSMTRDIWEGKPSEIEYRNGTVVRLGLKYLVNTPVNKFVYHSILPMELRARNILQ